MRSVLLLIAISTAAFAQQAPAPSQAIEPAPAPAAAAPAAPAGPAPTLQDVHKLYIDKMANDLDQYIRAEIVKQLAYRFTVVLKKEDADAILTGVGEYKNTTGAQITGRYLGLHDNATASVSMIDKAGTVVIWSSEAGDRSLLLGAMKRGGPRKVADRLVSKLKKAVEGK